MFVPSAVFAAEGNTPPAHQCRRGNGNVYVVVAGNSTRTRAGAAPRAADSRPTTESLMFRVPRAELETSTAARNWRGCDSTTALRQEVEVNAETLISIDPDEMAKLYREGTRRRGRPRVEYGSPELYDPPASYVRGGGRKRCWK